MVWLKTADPRIKLPAIALPVMALSLLAALLCANLGRGFDHEGARLSFVSDDGHELQMRDRDGNTLSYMYGNPVTESQAASDGSGVVAVTYIDQGFLFVSDAEGWVFTFSDGSRVTLDNIFYTVSRSKSGVSLGGVRLTEPQLRDWQLYEKSDAVSDFHRAVFDGGGLLVFCALGCLLALAGAFALAFPCLLWRLSHISAEKTAQPPDSYLSQMTLAGLFLSVAAVAIQPLLLLIFT